MVGFAKSDSPLFEEWLSLSEAEKYAEASPAKLGKGDAVVVIDMQADFVPADASSNPSGGRFGVAEGGNIVAPIVRLINEAVAKGVAVVATRDYHPVDHVSFISEGGPFPAHCVQGTKGSYFLEKIAGALAAGVALRGGGADGVSVAFKAFHEDVDSFGGFPYADGGEGRILKRAPGKDAMLTPRVQCPVGCTAAPWTGCVVVKQSALASRWLASGEEIDMNAPPDMLALMEEEGAGLCGECEVGGDGEAGDGVPRRGQLSMEELLKGKRRLLVCGLALDFCVLDTCLNAKAVGFGEVCVVLDAARAAHIPGLGEHGTGFLSDPAEVVAKLRAAGVKIIAASALCATVKIERKPSTLLEDAVGFPDCLAPIGLVAADVEVTLRDETTYEMTLTGPLLSLLPALENLGLGTSPHGHCSPLAPLPEGWPGAPEGATSVVWAYPIEGMAALLADGKATSGTGASTGGRHGALRAAAAAAAAASAVVSDATAGGGKGKWNLALRLAFLSLSRSPAHGFAAYGGFILLDKKQTVLRVQALGVGRPLHFVDRRAWRPEVMPMLEAAGRLQSVTLPSLLRAGAREFCWISPGEIFTLGPEKWRPSEFGGFLYRMHGRDPAFFDVIDPAVTQQVLEHSQRKVVGIQRRNTIAVAGAIGQASLDVDKLKDFKTPPPPPRSRGGGNRGGRTKAPRSSAFGFAGWRKNRERVAPAAPSSSDAHTSSSACVIL
jgi:nicotinamidase-related amidase